MPRILLSLLAPFVLSLAAAIGPSARAAIINPGFESGDLTGWQPVGDVSVLAAGGVGGEPAEGRFHALLVNHQAGEFGTPVGTLESSLGLSEGALDALERVVDFSPAWR